MTMYNQSKPGPKPSGRVGKTSSSTTSTPINSEHRRTQLREAQRRHRQRLRDEFDRLQGRVANLEQELTRSQQEREAVFVMMRTIMHRLNSHAPLSANTLAPIPPPTTTSPTANINLSPPNLPASTTTTSSDWYPPTPSDCSSSSVLDAAALQQANAALLDSVFQQQQHARTHRQAPPPPPPPPPQQQQTFPSLNPDMHLPVPLDAKFAQSTAYPTATDSDFMSWEAFAACVGRNTQPRGGGGWDWDKGL